MKILRSQQEFEEYLPESSIITIFEYVLKQIEEIREHKEYFGRLRQAHFVLKNLVSKEGKTINARIEYVVKVTLKTFNIEKFEAVIFDNMSDEMLDRYNEFITSPSARKQQLNNI